MTTVRTNLKAFRISIGGIFLMITTNEFPGYNSWYFEISKWILDVSELKLNGIFTEYYGFKTGI